MSSFYLLIGCSFAYGSPYNQPTLTTDCLLYHGRLSVQPSITALQTKRSKSSTNRCWTTHRSACTLSCTSGKNCDLIDYEKEGKKGHLLSGVRVRTLQTYRLRTCCCWNHLLEKKTVVVYLQRTQSSSILKVQEWYLRNTEQMAGSCCCLLRQLHLLNSERMSTV